MTQQTLIYLLFFAFMFVISLIINWILLKFVKTLGIRNRQETLIRWSPTSKPSIGGLGFFIIFLISVASQAILLKSTDNVFNFHFLGILFASTIGFLMGLFDDAFNTRPYVKLFTQIAAAIVLIVTGTYIHLFDYQPFNYLFTIFWVVGMMNSINMLDNMDAITSTVSIILISTILVLVFTGINFDGNYNVLLIGLLASLIGFLFFNWHPSKMYMGDTGSQFLGVFLAAMAIKYFWNYTEVNGTEIISKQILLPVIAFTVPIIDTTTVFIKRIKRGSSPFVGGKDHTTHHLSYLGLSDRQVAYVIALIASISASLVIIAYLKLFDWGLTVEILYSSYFILIFLILFYIANKNKHRN